MHAMSRTHSGMVQQEGEAELKLDTKCAECDAPCLTQEILHSRCRGRKCCLGTAWLCQQEILLTSAIIGEVRWHTLTRALCPGGPNFVRQDGESSAAQHPPDYAHIMTWSMDLTVLMHGRLLWQCCASKATCLRASMGCALMCKPFIGWGRVCSCLTFSMCSGPSGQVAELPRAL